MSDTLGPLIHHSLKHPYLFFIFINTSLSLIALLLTPPSTLHWPASSCLRQTHSNRLTSPVNKSEGPIVPITLNYLVT